MSRIWTKTGLLLAAALGVAGCSMPGGRGDAVAHGGSPAMPPAEGHPVDPRVASRYDDALAMLRRGEDQQAAAGLEALAAQHPELAGPSINLALIRARQNQPEAALALLEHAASVCRRCAPAFNEQGVLLRGLGRFAEAEGAYQKAIAADATYAPAHFNLAVLYELYAGRPEAAVAEYERYLELAGEPAGDVSKWAADLRRRSGGSDRASARGESP